jgi:hypothetical protein
MQTPFRCPECSAHINLERMVRIEERCLSKYPQRNAPTTYVPRIRIGHAAFCTRCDFAIEVQHTKG